MKFTLRTAHFALALIGSALFAQTGVAQPFNYDQECISSVSNSTIHVPSTINASLPEASRFELGDTLAVYTEPGKCAGFGVWRKGEGFTVAVAGKDTLETGKEGYVAGEPFKFELFRISTGDTTDFGAAAKYAACDETEIPFCGTGFYEKDTFHQVKKFGQDSTIPVELASFGATTKGAEVTLSWQTASETDNAGFVVERRTEGGSWSQIGFREGAGTTNQRQTYRYVNEDIPFETEQVTYRLRQEDLDGTTTLSDDTTVELGAPSETRLHAPFPNPVRGRATLRFELAEAADIRIAVYDVLGRRVRTVARGRVDTGRHQRRLQVGDLPAGTYFVQMQVGNAAESRRMTVVR